MVIGGRRNSGLSCDVNANQFTVTMRVDEMLRVRPMFAILCVQDYRGAGFGDAPPMR